MFAKSPEISQFWIIKVGAFQMANPDSMRVKLLFLNSDTKLFPRILETKLLIITTNFTK